MTWSAYLRTLHPPLSRHYHSYPPLQSDYLHLTTVTSTHGPAPTTTIGNPPAQTPTTSSLQNQAQQYPQRPPTPPTAHALRLRQQGRQAAPPTTGYETALHTAPHRTAKSSSSSSLIGPGGYTDTRDPISRSLPPNHTLLGGYRDQHASGNRTNHSSTTSQPTLFINRIATMHPTRAQFTDPTHPLSPPPITSLLSHSTGQQPIPTVATARLPSATTLHPLDTTPHRTRNAVANTAHPMEKSPTATTPHRPVVIEPVNHGATAALHN